MTDFALVDIPEAGSLRHEEIRWEGVAEPSGDGYDTKIAWELCPQRAPDPRDFARLDWNRPFGGMMEFDDSLPSPWSGMAPAPADHPNIARAWELVRLWPEAAEQLLRIIERLHFFVSVPARADQVTGGYCVGHKSFARILTSLDHHAGAAENLLHEMGHTKLFMLGLPLTGPGRFFTNAPEELYPSPIRHDQLRPMSAVFHAQYSFTYVMELDCRIVDAGLDPVRDEVVARNQIAEKLRKLEFGAEVVREHARLDREGARFIQGYFGWWERVRRRAEEILDRMGIEAKPFTHPQATQWRESLSARKEPAGMETTSQEISGGSVARPAEGAMVCEVEREMIVCAPGSPEGITLNASARAIWELCDGKRSVDEIAATIAERFGCTQPDEISELRSDIATAIAQFHKAGLVALA